MKKQTSSFLMVIFCCLSHLKAQEVVPASYVSGGVFYDQDYTLEMAGFKNINEDRNYTMGAGFYYSASNLEKWVIFKPHNWLFEKLVPQNLQANKFYNVMLANGSYTPDSLPARYPIYNDRPYSSLTYLQANVTAVDVHHHRTSTISISFGIIGSNISKAIQTYIHTHQNDGDTKNPRTPRGWGFQVSNGGSPTALLALQKDYLITTEPLNNRESGVINHTRRLGGEWKAAWKINAGWYNSLAGEISYRFGWLDPRKWTYLTNALGSSNMITKNKEAKDQANEKNTIGKYYEKPRKTELYLFSTIRNNLVIYNVLLSGQGGADAVDLPNKWVRHGVLDGSAGLCLSPVIGHVVIIDLKGKFNFRSPEFEAPGRKPRWHYWGGIELIVTVLH